MVRFVDVPNMRRWLIDTGIERAIAGIADTIAEDFRRWEQFDKTARVASHSDIGVIELMPTSDGVRVPIWKMPVPSLMVVVLAAR